MKVYKSLLKTHTCLLFSKLHNQIKYKYCEIMKSKTTIIRLTNYLLAYTVMDKSLNILILPQPKEKKLVQKSNTDFLQINFN